MPGYDLFPNPRWRSRDDRQRPKPEPRQRAQEAARTPGPELSCEECFEELDRYVELELGEADADARIPGMREHLEGCSACAEDHRSLRALVERDIGSPAPLPGD
jgi:hypothetical protein